MKKLFLLTVLMVALSARMAFAADFAITASIPAANTVNFIVSEVTPSDPPVFVSYPSTNLSFDTAGLGMKYLAGPNIWVGDHFFAIDLSPSDGTNPAPGTYGSISFSYSAQVVPAGQPPGEGLNKRATLAAVKVNSDATENLLRAGALGNSFTAITNSEVAGGFLRVYVGTATGELDTNNNPLIPGSVPFTNADKPGTYTGTLTITATLV